MPTSIGRGVFLLDTAPSVSSFAAVAGKKEGEGPLGVHFDRTFNDTRLGQESWEKAESQLQKNALEIALQKGNLSPEQIGLLFAGDLLNQCIGSSYGLRDLQIPFFGVYGACSTMAESLMLAAMSVDSGTVSHAAAVTSSHFCSAERQFRYPLEYGGIRTPTAQWTVTGSGAAVVSHTDTAPYLLAAAAGRIVDLGVTDINNMGAAMAPAAADTLIRFFHATDTRPSEYDLILTGDLGFVGSSLLYELTERDGYIIRTRHNDCGMMIFDREKQDVHAGGSGCGCSASVLCSFILNEIKKGRLNRVLFLATGALMSTVSNQQGETIPAIAHLLLITSKKEAFPWNSSPIV